MCLDILMVLNFFLSNLGLRLKSSPYGLNILGYTRVTMAKTESYERLIVSESLKIVKVRIVLCNSKT